MKRKERIAPPHLPNPVKDNRYRASVGLRRLINCHLPLLDECITMERGVHGWGWVQHTTAIVTRDRVMKEEVEEGTGKILTG